MASDIQKNAPKKEPGGTQREIFRIIVRRGGFAAEHEIRRYLLEKLDVRSERGVKEHLKAMELANLICKVKRRGAPIAWYLTEGIECYMHLCTLISLSQHDTDMAKDIQDFFSKNIASGHEDSILEGLISYNTDRIKGYITDILNAEFTDKRKGEYEGTEAWLPDDETMKIVYLIAGRSPSLFSVGAQTQNRLFVALIRVLMGEQKYPVDHPHMYFKWLIFHIIAASLITDHCIYHMNIWRNECEELRKIFEFFEDIGDLKKLCNKNTAPFVYVGGSVYITPAGQVRERLIDRQHRF